MQFRQIEAESSDSLPSAASNMIAAEARKLLRTPRTVRIRRARRAQRVLMTLAERQLRYDRVLSSVEVLILRGHG